MIQLGSRVVVRTSDAIFQTAELMAMNKKNITIRYCRGTEWDHEKSRMVADMKTEVIDRKKIYYLGERY